jgi:hypothetical protein
VDTFSDFSVDSPIACFHADAKHCLRRTALSTFGRKIFARFGTCLRTLFGIPFVTGHLPNLSPLMSCRNSEGLGNFGSLAGAYSYALNALLHLSINCRFRRVAHLLKLRSRPSAMISAFSESERASPRGTYKGVKESELAPPSLSSFITTGPHCPEVPVCSSTVRPSNHSADRLPTC